jgi:5-methylcytosine-specific restriction endonuclease McrA
MATKKPINRPKTRNKNSSQAQICCFRCFQGKKKTLKHNPPHHMEPFDTKINYFGGQNLSQ